MIVILWTVLFEELTVTEHDCFSGAYFLWKHYVHVLCNLFQNKLVFQHQLRIFHYDTLSLYNLQQLYSIFLDLLWLYIVFDLWMTILPWLGQEYFKLRIQIFSTSNPIVHWDPYKCIYLYVRKLSQILKIFNERYKNQSQYVLLISSYCTV